MPEFIEEIQDNIEDVAEGAKKTFSKLKKNKVFMFGLVGVGVLGVIALLKNREESVTEASMIVPTGYSGYPSINNGSGASSGGGYASSDSFADLTDFDYLLSDTKTELKDIYDSKADELYSNIQYMEDRVTNVEQIHSTEIERLQRQNIITQMQNNSNMYALTNDADTREYLHAQNEALASMLGDVYYSNDGYWRDSETDTILYHATVKADSPDMIMNAYNAKGYSATIDYAGLIQEAKTKGYSDDVISGLEQKRIEKIVGEGLNQYVTYDATVDYAQKINDAIKNGATSAEIEYLQMQRQAKIEGEGLNNDGTKKKTSSGSSSSKTTTTKTSGGTLSKGTHNLSNGSVGGWGGSGTLTVK